MTKIVAVAAIAFENGTVGRMQLAERDRTAQFSALSQLRARAGEIAGEITAFKERIEAAAAEADAPAKDLPAVPSYLIDQTAFLDKAIDELETSLSKDDEWSDADIQAEVDKNAETWAAIGLKAVGWHRCTHDDFPVEHHDFRDAWTIKDGKVVVDIDRARQVTRQRLRAERGAIMARNDVESLRAMEAKDEKKLAAILAEKQRLRDITKHPAIDKAKTLDDLRGVLIEPPTS